MNLISAHTIDSAWTFFIGVLGAKIALQFLRGGQYWTRTSDLLDVNETL